MMLVTLTGITMAHKSMKAHPTKRGGADAKLAMDNEMLHWHKVTSKQMEQVLGFHIFIEQKREKNINAHKVIGNKKQCYHVVKDYVSSPMVLKERVIPTCAIDA